MSKRATSAAMAELHAKMAAVMKEFLSNGVKEVDNNGELVSVTPPAAYLNVVRQFLKDNGIDSPTVGEELNSKAIFQGLPFTQTDEHGPIN
jgi:hypothetical protein